MERMRGPIIGPTLVRLVQERHDNRDQRHRVPRRSQEADRTRRVVPSVYIFMYIYLFPFMDIIYLYISQSPTVGDWARLNVQTDGLLQGKRTSATSSHACS